MIAVLAVLAIAAAVLLPMLVKELDKSTADQERATLKSFADAFQQYVLSTRTIPDQTYWYSAISSKMGVGANDVLYNAHQRALQIANSRVFLIDPALSVGLGSSPSGLAYTQANFILSVANCPTNPSCPRLMIVSSLGLPLPSTVASGVFSPSGHRECFSNLWYAADGTVPSDFAWNGWAGNGADVIVQRLNLAPLFVHLLVGKYNSTNTGAFSIDASAPILAANIDGYMIQGSVLGLYTNNSTGFGPYTQQILTRDSSFVFENQVWRGNLSGGTAGGGGNNLGVMNLPDVVQQFLNAPANVNAKNGSAQQSMVVNSMLNYMSNYNVWANGNYADATMKSYLISLQGVMMTNLQGIYYAGTPSYYPTNPSPCVQ